MVETMDNGKPIRETMAVDIPLSAQHFRYFGGLHHGRRRERKHAGREYTEPHSA